MIDDIDLQSIAPSGAQYPIHFGKYHAVIVEVGGGIRTLSHDGFAIIDGYDHDAMCDSARGQLLLPWPNRIEDATYSNDQRVQQLSINEPATGCAIHGLTRWASWRCVDHSQDRVSLTHVLHPQPGWPGTLLLTVHYTLGDHGMTVQVTAENIGTTTVPFGAGAHPYLRVHETCIDQWEISLPAQTMWTADERGIPISHQRTGVVGLDRPRMIGNLVLDHAFTDLVRDAKGIATVEINGPNGRSIALWVDASHHWLQVFTGDHLADQSQRRRSIAVEPMTCPPNAFRTGIDVVELAPSDRITVTWGITATSPTYP